MKKNRRLIMAAYAFVFSLVCGGPDYLAFAAAPGAGKAAPRAEKAAPRAEKTVPPAEKAVPRAEKAAPRADKDDQADETPYNPLNPLNPLVKPDPFRPFVEKELVLKKQAEKAPPSSIYPLQKAGVEQFNLVGIAGDAKRRLAIVEAKDNKGRFYPIALGTVIGLNSGKVVEIRNDRMVVEEVAQKGRKTNKIIIKLHRDEEEGAP